MCGVPDQATGSQSRRKPLRSDPPIRYSRNSRRYLIGPVALAIVLLATPVFGQESRTASEVGNWVVVIFGMLLWVAFVLSVFALGIRVIVAGPYSRTKHKGGSQKKLRVRGRISRGA
jgi:hypothetical protein